MQPQTKLQQLLDLMQQERWDEALALAAKFPELGDHKARIVRGHEANQHPRFYKSLGKDITALRQDGIAALRERYEAYRQ